MKVIYEFDPEEDRNKLAMHQMAEAMYSVLWDFDQALRNKWKYGEGDGAKYAGIHREVLHSFMDEYSIDLDRVE